MIDEQPVTQEDEESNAGVTFVFVGLALVILFLVGLTIYMLCYKAGKARPVPKIVVKDSIVNTTSKMNGADATVVDNEDV